MCRICDAYADPVRIYGPEDWQAVLTRIDHATAQGDLELMSGNCPLDALRQGAPWPTTAIKLTFGCATCSRLFILELGTYHSVGGEWRPLFGN